MRGDAAGRRVEIARDNAAASVILRATEFKVLCGAGPNAADSTPAQRFSARVRSGHGMFVIESGEVQLEFGDGLPHKLLGPREFFGELALFIGNHARVATAVAKTSCNLRVIESPAFDHLLDHEPAMLAQFMRRSFTYLVASEQQLIANLKRHNEDLLATLDSLRQTQTPAIHRKSSGAHR